MEDCISHYGDPNADLKREIQNGSKQVHRKLVLLTVS
jgi:hypothetical protein